MVEWKQFETVETIKYCTLRHIIADGGLSIGLFGLTLASMIAYVVSLFCDKT